MACSLCWMFAIHLLALAAKAVAHTHASDSSDSSDACCTSLERAVSAEPQWWRALALFAGSFAWFALPLERVAPAERQGGALRQLCQVLLRHGALAASKLLALVAAAAWLQRCLAHAPGGSGAALRGDPSAAVAATAVFSLVVFATWLNDVQIMAVRALSGNRFTVQAFNDWPYLAASPREFWGRRYNRLVGALLRSAVYQPLRALGGASSAQATLAAFAVSGLLHMHVALVTFQSGVAATCAFFALHGLAVAVEHYYGQPAAAPPAARGGGGGGWAVRVSLTLAFQALTAPLYLGQFVYAWPRWNMAPPPWMLAWAPTHAVGAVAAAVPCPALLTAPA